MHSDDGEAELLNLQCRYLALDDVDADFFGHERLRRGNMPGLRAKYSDRAMLDRALSRIGSIEVAGLAEQVDEVAARIAERMEWPAPPRLERLNARRAPFNPYCLTPRALQRTLELTRLDCQLYEEVKRMVLKRSDELSPMPCPSYIPS